MQYDRLPQVLKETGLFAGWRSVQRKGKTTKIPVNLLTGKNAKSNDESTFCSFTEAVSRLGGCDGLGVKVSGNYQFIDCDHCVEGGTLNAFAQKLVAMFPDCYVEISQSGSGIHIIVFAEDFWYDKTRYYVNNHKMGLEVYAGSVTSKFVALTGNAIQMGNDSNHSELLQKLLDKYMQRPITTAKTSGCNRHSYLSDESVLERLTAGKQSAKFTRLWDGDTTGYGSSSEADMALLQMLSFWCGGNADQMDRLFRQSGLMRDKWNRPQSGSTYGRISIEKAISTATDFYKPIRTVPAVSDFGISGFSLNELHPDDNDRYAWTDIGAAELFADCFKSVARFVPERKTWYFYADGIWKQDTANLKVMESCKRLADALIVYALTITDERQRSSYLDYTRRWQQRKYRETILKDAQSVYPISVSEFDRDPLAFNCKNGTLHLDSGEFTPHCPEDRFTRISPVVYDPTSRCERFERFVGEIMSGDRDKQHYLQKAMGYGLSGDSSFECMFILHGKTSRNGKGTLCESVLRVLGSYSCTARPETIGMKANSNSQCPSEDIARLAGVRFVNIAEPQKGLVLNAALVKTLTGNDTINARFLHENSFDFRPQFKLFVNTNYLPVINDLSAFASGRVIVIPFDRHFDEQEQDRTLKNEFSKEKSQSGILNWLVEGYGMLRQEGLAQPEVIRQAIGAYAHDSDKIMQFVEDCLKAVPTDEVRTAAVYDAYRQWCVDNGCYAENSRNFNQALRRFATVERKRPRNGGGQTTLLLGYRLVVKDFLST